MNVKASNRSMNMIFHGNLFVILWITVHGMVMPRMDPFCHMTPSLLFLIPDKSSLMWNTRNWDFVFGLLRKPTQYIPAFLFDLNVHGPDAWPWNGLSFATCRSEPEQYCNKLTNIFLRNCQEKSRQIKLNNRIYDNINLVRDIWLLV